MYISQILATLENEGVYEIESCYHLWTQEKIIEEQKDWDEKDACKNYDFTGSNYWLTSTDMQPVPYESFAEYIEENY